MKRLALSALWLATAGLSGACYGAAAAIAALLIWADLRDSTRVVLPLGAAALLLFGLFCLWAAQEINQWRRENQ